MTTLSSDLCAKCGGEQTFHGLAYLEGHGYHYWVAPAPLISLDRMMEKHSQEQI